MYKVKEEGKQKKSYVLGMFPYPSGDGLHVGHVRVFGAVDVLARYQRMKGMEVLAPMGWDSFGLPAENAAIKKQANPMDMVPKNENNFKRQLMLVGTAYDWERCFSTTDPKYYKWTQWLFLQLYSIKNSRGERLVYRKEVPINWCPFCKTGLANEEVLGDGTHERCGNKVEQRMMKQWMMRITDYADRLLSDLMHFEWVDEEGKSRQGLDWSRGILEMQKNWIGKREGVRVRFKIQDLRFMNQEIEVFTTRLDTIGGVTFMAAAPEKIKEWMEKGFKASRETAEYVSASLIKTEQQRLEEAKVKTGVDTGVKVINPVTGEEVPVWVADYVLGNVGTGYVMGVPAHDERDFEFAMSFELPIKVVVAEAREVKEEGRPVVCYTCDGFLVHSGKYTGMTSAEAREAILRELKLKKLAEAETTYHLRDWIFSRQRYWGEPFPLVYCEKCGDENGVVPVADEDLPLQLPKLESYAPTATGESPLSQATEWVKTTCPKCGGPARRETDTMPNWAGSCWYFLYFALNKEEMERAGKRGGNLRQEWEEIIKPKTDRWVPVDWYLGGAEHAVLHLLYARFWMKAFFDLGLVKYSEPFARLRDRGTVLAEDGRKMSKSWGNVVNPDEMVERFGADTLRIYEMFMGPWDQAISWDTKALVGCYRFLERVWKLSEEAEENEGETEKALGVKLEKLIAKVGRDTERLKFNTAVAAMMEFINAWQAAEKGLSRADMIRFVTVLAIYAPFMAEELYQRHAGTEGGFVSVHNQPWPEHKQVKDEELTVIIQVNGRLRGTIVVPAKVAENQEKVEAMALAEEKIKRWVEGEYKAIYVPGRVLNLIIPSGV